MTSAGPPATSDLGERPVGRLAGLGVFARGAAVGLLVMLPLEIVALILCARARLAAEAPLAELTLIAVAFAGLPALLLAGGVARLVWHRAARAGARSRAVAYRAASLGGALTGMALVLLVAVPLGGLPELRARWLVIIFAGAAAGCVGALPLAPWIGRARRLW